MGRPKKIDTSISNTQDVNNDTQKVETVEVKINEPTNDNEIVKPKKRVGAKWFPTPARLEALKKGQDRMRAKGDIKREKENILREAKNEVKKQYNKIKEDPIHAYEILQDEKIKRRVEKQKIYEQAYDRAKIDLENEIKQKLKSKYNRRLTSKRYYDSEDSVSSGEEDSQIYKKSYQQKKSMSPHKSQMSNKMPHTYSVVYC